MSFAILQPHGEKVTGAVTGAGARRVTAGKEDIREEATVADMAAAREAAAMVADAER